MKARADCSTCGKPQYLRLDGNVGAHNKGYSGHVKGSVPHCEGVGKPPK